MFIRRKNGIEHLEELLRNVEKARIPFRQHAKNLYEIQAILKEIDGVKAEINKIGSFFLGDEQLRSRKLLKTRLDVLFDQLEELAKRKA